MWERRVGLGTSEEAAASGGTPKNTGRGLTLLLGSNVALLIAELFLVVALVLGVIAVGGLTGGDAGAAAGGLIGLLVGLLASVLLLFIWLILAIVAIVFLFLGRDEIDDPHPTYCLVGVGLLAAAVIGSGVLGGGMLVGTALIGSGDVPTLQAVGQFAVALIGLAGQVLLLLGLQGASGRNLLYGYGGVGATSGGLAMAGGLAAMPVVGLVGTGLGVVAQVLYLVVIVRTRRRIREGRPRVVEEPVSEPAPAAAGGGSTASGPSEVADDVLVVACSECDTRIKVEERTRPLVVECPGCGQKGVVKAPPPGGAEEE